MINLVIFVFFVLDQSKSLTFYACGTSGPLEKNYTVCFTSFSICMTVALIIATRFDFSYDNDEQVPLNTLNRDLKRTINPTGKSQQTNQQYIHNVINDEPQIEINVNEQQQYHSSNAIKIMQLIQIFFTLKNGIFLFIAW